LRGDLLRVRQLDVDSLSPGKLAEQALDNLSLLVDEVVKLARVFLKVEELVVRWSPMSRLLGDSLKVKKLWTSL
jgi:hypothetical protein